jgi:hypothetical protein
VNSKLVIGWREWVVLPDLGLPAIKAKIDTGARTSALHALNITKLRKNGRDYVNFDTQPVQMNTETVINCEAPLLDVREVKNSGGQRETRLVIETRAIIGARSQLISLTLTDRNSMRFRMLLGRKAMEHWAFVNPAASYLCKIP